MRIVSRCASKSFLQFRIFEHFLVSFFVLVGVPICLFFTVGMIAGRRRGQDRTSGIEFYMDHVWEIMIIAAVLMIIVNAAIVRFRSIRYVVAAELDDLTGDLVLQVRGLKRSSLHEHRIPFTRFAWQKHATPKVIAIPSYRGYRFMDGTSVVGHLLTDHFTWDDQNKRVKAFLAELDRRVALGTSRVSL